MMNQVMTSAQTSFYVTGGTLQRNAPSYVQRRADDDLYEGLSAGQFCYVLTSRQMGKSSLMVQTAARLREEGTAVAVLDLTAIGQNLTAEQWYDGLLNRVGQQLKLEDELEDFWLDNERTGPLQRWMRAIREVVLERLKGRFVIFVDEIDAVRSLPFSTDEFFAGIREFYNRRTEDVELSRLTFCLLGVATPSDLIRDTRTTPFNIGQRIELTDFDEREAAPLIAGLGRAEQLGAVLLTRILYWTGGHPYLTQRLCQAVAEDAGVTNQSGVDRLCENLFLSSRARERDDNLLFVRERLLRSETDRAALLDLYAQMRTHKQRVQDDEANPLVSVLRLSGITRIVAGYHYVRNRIYYRVFDREWITANMPGAELQRQRAAYRRGQMRMAAIAAFILTVMTGLTIFAFQQRNHARAEARRAEQQELENRRLLYNAQMNLVQQAWGDADFQRVQTLLDEQRPKAEQADLRDAQWHYLWRLSHSFLSDLSLNCQAVGHAQPVDCQVRSLAFSPDGKLLATGNADHTIWLWDVAAQKPVAVLKRHEEPVQAVAFSPDGQILAAGSSDKTVTLWSVGTRKLLAILKGHTNLVSGVSFSPDGKVLASVSRDRSLKLWDVAQQRESVTVSLQGIGWLTAVAFSHNGKMLAVSGSRNTIKLIDVESNKELFTFAPLPRDMLIMSVAFSPDDKLLASGGADKTVRLWDVTPGSEASPLIGRHTGQIWAVAFSPDGNFLATGSEDNTVKLWDVRRRQELITLPGHKNSVNSVSFAPDGRVLASGSWDGTVKLWNVALNNEALVERK